MKTRDYQNEAVRSTIECLNKHRSALVVKATGTGKTVVIAHVIKEMAPDRVLVLAHREELIQQLAETIGRVCNTKPEIEKASSWARSLDNGGSPVVVATVQTMMASWTDKKRMERFGHREFDLIVIDEAHHSAARSYQQIVNYFDAPVMGVTATPKRGDKTALGTVFKEVAYVYGIREAIEDGWLVPVRQRRVVVDSLDISGIRVTAGDLNGAQLAEALEQEKTLHAMVGPTFDIAGGRPTLMFCASVAQATRAAEIWNRRGGGEAAVVTGTTDKVKRREIFDAFKAGAIQCITNVGVATEGTDLPVTAVVAMARPTRSSGLYQQMLGRGTRPLTGIVDGLSGASERKAAIEASDKPYVEVIDFVGNSGRHKLITPIDILGGNYPDEVLEKAVTLLEDGELVDPEAALEQAQALVDEAREELRRQLEQERLKIEEMRRKLRVEAKYKSHDVDPFDLLDVPPPAALPKSTSAVRIRMASEKQARTLIQNGIDPTGMTMKEAQSLVGKIIQRSRQGLCSYKQMRLLHKFGIDGEMMSRVEAKKQIDRIAQNGWRA